MSRLDLARMLLVVSAAIAGAVVFFLLVLRREQRRRSGWSTRDRQAHPHWSISLHDRLAKVAERLSARRPKPRRRKSRQRL